MHKNLSRGAVARLLAATLLASACVGPASAASLVEFDARGNDLDTTGTRATLLAATVGFRNGAAVDLTLEVDADDVGGWIAFDAILSDAGAGPFSALDVWLDRGTFALVGDVTAQFGMIASVGGSDTAQRIRFDPAEPFGVDLGNPFSQAGPQSWLVGFDGLVAGDRVTLSLQAVPVPEPSSALLTLSGFAVLGAALRRRRRTHR
jgi:hypothetical protein